MKKKIVLAVLLTMVLVMSFATAVESKEDRGRKTRKRPGWQKKSKIYVLNDAMWFNYSDMSIRWHANDTEVAITFLVDLDGEHDSAAISQKGIWHIDYGECVDVGVRLGHLNKWACRIGEYKIDSNPEPPYYEWHIQDDYGEGEYFCFTLQTTTPPSDFLVILHASDGSQKLPVTETFWVSIDEGVSWIPFTP